jgi:hypothetical protein
MRASLTIIIALLSGVVAPPLPAQWYVGIEFGVKTYRGSTRDTSSTHVASEGRPGGGPTVGISVGRAGRRVGGTVRVSYAKPGFAVSGNGVTLTDKGTGRLIEISSLLSTRVGGIGPSGAVWVELGPALHLWDFNNDMQPRWSVLGGAAYEWAIGRRFLGAVRLEGMLSPSWFDATDAPPEFERRVTWRYGVGLGLRYRL